MINQTASKKGERGFHLQLYDDRSICLTFPFSPSVVSMRLLYHFPLLCFCGRVVCVSVCCCHWIYWLFLFDEYSICHQFILFGWQLGIRSPSHPQLLFHLFSHLLSLFFVENRFACMCCHQLCILRNNAHRPLLPSSPLYISLKNNDGIYSHSLRND